MAKPDRADESMRGDILLVDDQPDVVSSIGRVLKFNGYHVRAATSAEAAVKLAAERMPGLLLTDIVMPERSGIELARELRQMRPELPIVFMTGYADVQQEAAAVGPAAVMVKPVDLEDLLAVLDQFL